MLHRARGKRANPREQRVQVRLDALANCLESCTAVEVDDPAVPTNTHRP